MTDDALNKMNRLIAEDHCRTLLLKAASLTDNGNASEFAELFSLTATLRRPDGQTLSGRDAIVASYESRPLDRVTRHLVLGSIFTHVSSEKVSAITDAVVWIGSLADDVEVLGRPAGKQVVGRFKDDFVLTKAGWKIATRDASFDFFIA